MQRRNVVFASGENYHIYNRSVGREQAFTSLFHLRHIFQIIDYYRYHQELKFSEFNRLKEQKRDLYLYKISLQTPIVEIYSFAFMPNHFHFLLKQTQDNGIKNFISNIQNSHAKYINTKYDRHGGLFQSPFQGKWIENDEQFMHISRYIHLNPVTAYKIQIEDLDNYPFASFSDYMGNRYTSWLNTKTLGEMLSSTEKHKRFVYDQVDYQRTLADIKDKIID